MCQHLAISEELANMSTLSKDVLEIAEQTTPFNEKSVKK